MRGAAVERISLPEEIPKPTHGICHLQQWTLSIVLQPALQFFGRGAQVEHVRLGMQRVSVGWPQDGAPTRGQHDALLGAQLFYRLLLDVAEGCLTVRVEVLADWHGNPALDLVITVDKPQSQLPRQVAPNCGFATAGHADQADLQTGINWGWCRVNRKPIHRVW